jgi:hypothetical protein
MRNLRLSIWITFTALLLGISNSYADSREETTINKATEVLGELLKSPDQNVPNWLIDRAYAVVVVPEVVKGGLVFGGRYGNGVMTIRKADGSWSNPVFVTIAGGSWGFQFGVQVTELMLVFTSKASVEGLIGGKVTLGVDASVAAGPVGRQGSAATDVNLSQIYSYSRNKGLFFGIALDGSALSIDHKSNAIYYTKPGILASEITSPTAPRPQASGEAFIATLTTKAVQSPSANKPAEPVSSSTSTQTPDTTNTHQSSGLVTYPMEDSKPGSEPPK